jgi:hypothetical protein
LTFRTRDVLIIALVFVLIEILIWGFALWWVVTYVIYWSMLTIAVSFISRIRIFKKVKAQPNSKKHIYNISVIKGISVGILFTIFFGVLSTFIEIIVFRGIATPNFFLYFSIRYTIGFPFFVTHIFSNVVALSIVVPILTNRLTELNKLIY